MRKDIQKERQGTKKQRIFYLSSGVFAVIILIIAVGLIISGNMQNDNMEKAENEEITSLAEAGNRSTEAKQASSQVGKSVNEVKEESKTQNTTNNVIVVPKTEEKKSKPSTTSNTIDEIPAVDEKKTEVKKETEPVFAMPVSGEVSKEFAKDKLVYSDTLKEWVTHSGIDIKADKTTVVKSSEAGTVKSIKNDPRYGLTVVIEHSCGYSTVYSNLLTAEFVVVGEKVEKGQTIGTVGNTATFEIADDSHLHFEILKDNVQIDPGMYIK